MENKQVLHDLNDLFVPCRVQDLDLRTSLKHIAILCIQYARVCTNTRLRLHNEYTIDSVAISTTSISLFFTPCHALSPPDPQCCFPGRLLARLMLCNAYWEFSQECTPHTHTHIRTVWCPLGL